MKPKGSVLIIVITILFILITYIGINTSILKSLDDYLNKLEEQHKQRLNK